MLGVLEIAFRHHDVAGGLGIAAELEVLVGHRLGGAADLHVRTVALVDAAQRVAAAASAAAAATAATSAAMAVAVAVLVSRSHRHSIFRLGLILGCSALAHETCQVPWQFGFTSAQKVSVFKLNPLV